MLKGKTVILGITGSIAAYKMANVASMLKKLHCNVEVIMTKNAVNFINPITFETLTGNKCLIDTEFSVSGRAHFTGKESRSSHGRTGKCQYNRKACKRDRG